ncbi:MAG: hypothetical protein BMS9Abin13_645 [Patescibacteria group bacterium]|nr:MAG: hypothetical protein BMS9Abin13_645 [Patescibacteria group bacterium]
MVISPLLITIRPGIVTATVLTTPAIRPSIVTAPVLGGISIVGNIDVATEWRESCLGVAEEIILPRTFSFFGIQFSKC